MSALKYTKKVLIDPRELDKINTAVRDNDLPGNTTKDIDSDMKKILDREDLSAFDKMQLYGQTLQRYIRMDNQRGKQSLNITLSSEGSKKTNDTVAEPNGDDDAEADDEQKQQQQQEHKPEKVDTDDLLERQLLDTVPKPLKKKAKNLFLHLKSHRTPGTFTWSPEGEIKVSGKKVAGSNLIDLIYDTLKSRQGYENPVGWGAFNQALALINTPESLVGNVTRRLALRKRKAGESDDVEKTPPPPPRKRSSARKGKHRLSSPLRFPWETYKSS